MSLGWTTATVAALAILLFVLKRIARRRDFEGFARRHSGRKRRVYAADLPLGPAPHRSPDRDPSPPDTDRPPDTDPARRT